ncbi:ABC transporter ATP-binding protein [Lactobacillus paragasseri]|uniref:ABC transporter ATP-binding protein n=1 Tax=Lactobacillus paragasseri TaxID=2107999 RepID=A0ABD5A2C3_9LACO|nr:ABC transporter ATP-binding protein [Lactobacillus paragasseri]MDK7953242.1 ABC transporter ATP-binding protein [Lactobacillus paragasseri]MDO6361890.1 ABC transporter ATP-binding protein [Lactobacillus paragasseri]MDX5060220.1 ABC transporter ATP-binding protein [Lactobacillus paragasseri]
MLLKVRNLSKSFQNGTKAIEDLSFDIPAGKITTFLGFNGAGKTTSLKIILNLLLPDEGKIYFENKLLKNDFTPLLKQTGVVLESTRNMFYALTPMENFIYWGAQRGLNKKVARKNGLELLEKFDLLSKKDTVIFELSRGMQQIIAICCALISKPKFLVLDEPTLGLDIEAVKTVERILKTLASEGVAILLTTHELAVAQRIADQILLIKKGRLIYSGSKADCLDKFNQEKFITVQFSQALSNNQRAVLESIAKIISINNTTYQLILSNRKNLSHLLKFLTQFKLMDLKTKNKGLNEVVDFYMKGKNEDGSIKSGISA